MLGQLEYLRGISAGADPGQQVPGGVLWGGAQQRKDSRQVGVAARQRRIRVRVHARDSTGSALVALRLRGIALADSFSLGRSRAGRAGRAGRASRADLGSGELGLAFGLRIRDGGSSSHGGEGVSDE